MVDGRRGTITIKPNPTPAGWVTRTREQWYQRSSPTVVKVVNLTSGFPAWVSNKGAGNPQGIWPCRPVGFDHRIGGKQRLQSWEGRNKTLCATKTQGQGAVAPQETEPGLPAYVGGPPMEVRVHRGSPQGWGNQSEKVLPWRKSLLEVASNLTTEPATQSWVLSGQKTTREAAQSLGAPISR